ncbi:hypothetical protein R50072_37800 [Simiduia litorea]
MCPIAEAIANPKEAEVSLSWEWEYEEGESRDNPLIGFLCTGSTADCVEINLLPNRQATYILPISPQLKSLFFYYSEIAMEYDEKCAIPLARM